MRRKEGKQMTETTDPNITMAIDMKKYRLRIHKQTLKLLGSPFFVQLLISPKSRVLVILRCEKEAPGGQEIPVTFDKPNSSGTFDIYSKELITRIQKEFGGLDLPGLYRLEGFPVPEKNGVCFPLSTLRFMEDPHV